jgi:hypothetical protein
MTSSTNRLRTPGRRAATALLATAVVAAGPAVSSAQAQSTADQYGTAGATGTAANAITRVDFTTFGSVDEKVRRDVRTALNRAALPFRDLRTTDGRILRLIDGPFGRTVSADGPNALGVAVGQALTDGTASAPRLFRTLFVTDDPYRPIVADVVTRTENISQRQDAFSRGAAEGFAKRVPTVYVERTDDKTPHLDEFRKIPGVQVVDNIDTDAGKARLVQLLTRSNGAAATSASDDGRIDAQTQAAVGRADDGNGLLGPAALLAVVVGGIAFVTAGLGRRRRGRGVA